MELRRYTATTITDIGDLRADLELVGMRGFALDDEEDEEEVRCVGAAVLDHRAIPIGGICVSAPTFRLSREAAVELGPKVLDAARQISLALGAAPDRLPPPCTSAGAHAT